MENSQTTATTTPHSASVVPPSVSAAAGATGISLEGHPLSILADDHHSNHRSNNNSSGSGSSNNNNNNSGSTTPSGGRGFLKSTTNTTTSSSSSPSSNQVTTTPSSTRRTRHRVDAGEPRGCFNNYYSPRNIFQNSSSSPISSHSTSTAAAAATSSAVPHPHSHHPVIPPTIVGPLGSSGGILGNSSAPVVPGPEYYFQPMKMLSDFIGNSHSHFNSHNSQAAASQLLLREMLQKKKIGYEEDVSEIAAMAREGREQQLQRHHRSNSEESLGCSSGNNNNNNNNDSSPNNNNINNNNNNEEIKINGCKKRKLYQPQKSEFDDEQEEFKDVEDEADMDYKNNISDVDDEEMMVKSPMAPLTRELLACERKQIPRSILQNWKENFKSTLMTHINELVDTQFNVLFGSIGSPPNGNSLSVQQHHHHHLPHQHGASHPHHPASGNSRTGGGMGRQQSVTPPPAQTAPPPASSLPTSERGGGRNVDREVQGESLVTKNHHFNGGGGSVLLNDSDKLRMRFYRPPYSSALAGLAASNNRDVFDEDGPLSLVVTPKKKRHKVTDTRLTPRAVSRLLGNGSTPSDHYHMESTPSPRSQLPSPPGSVPITLATSVAIPNPSLTESRHLFAPYAPLFNSVRSSLESPPTMIPHPMINPVEYVQQLREISAAQQQAQREHHQQQQQREPIHQATLLERERGGSAGSADSVDTNGGSFEITPGMVYGPGHSSSTLTPMHLRKAKLMFFWVRYPSSSVLKMYFPDIKFNKNNTAQLVKWFSNFREFYYIQMEKYARQALSEGIKAAEDIHVSTDNELYRVLNLHYNRNNHIEVPSNFRYVVEQTLREFFKAIQTGKDSEQSWKKAIYKVIARLDDPVPEYFKSPNFLEQLE